MKPTDLSTAIQLHAELDQVTAAIALVNRGSYHVCMEICAGDHAALRFNASNMPQGVLLSQLTARQKVLTDALTALGVS